jgi:predicted O-linked N-acetylglucosamine transferase (SPINDLY family)
MTQDGFTGWPLEDAATLFKQGRVGEAAKACHTMLGLHPEHSESLYILALIAQRDGDLDDALSWLARAIHLEPSAADYHSSRGLILQQAGRLDEALGSYADALELEPEHARAHNNRGTALLRKGRPEEAMAAHEEALRIDPDFAQAHVNRGACLERLGQLEEALAAYEEALWIQPRLAEAHLNTGVILERQGKPSEALDAYTEALQLAPEMAEAHFNRGNALSSLGQVRDALDALARAVEIRPQFVEALLNRGNLLSDLGRFDKAQDAYQQVIRIRPDFAQAHSNYLMSLGYDPNQDDASLSAAHREWGERHGHPPDAYRTHANPRDPEKTLRVGIVSPDLGLHPVGFMIAPLLASADPAKLHFVCYSDRAHEDELGEELKASVSAWHRTAALSHRALAERLRGDEIDILIDLAGHTANNRLPLFALKPAPIQVSWLGYRSTSGLAAIDYVLTDEVTVPPGTERWYEETVVHLPETRLCYRPIPNAPDPAAPPLLDRGSPTFGSFNNVVKTSPEALRLWARLLIAVPQARLLLKWRSLADPEVRARCHGLMEQFGVDPGRVELRGSSPHVEMLAEYGDIDVALDPPPFSGGVSTLEALWQGVPVITLPGHRQVSRQTQAHLTVLGRTEWIARDEDDYIRIVTELVHAPARLAMLRREQRAEMATSPLCDGWRFANHFHAALRKMWRDWCFAHPS